MPSLGATLWLRAVALCVLVCQSPGCAPLSAVGKSPLNSLVQLPDSIQIEKYSILYDHGDPDLNVALWDEIDEQCLPADLRARLAANGFRAGLIGSDMPAPLVQFLRDNPAAALPEFEESEDVPSLEELTGAPPIDVLNEPKVRRGLLQTHSGHPSKIIVAGEQNRLSSLPVLKHNEDGSVTGRLYEKVLAQFTLLANCQADGRVLLELTPEIEFGEAVQRYTASDGMFRFEFRPDTLVLRDLAIAISLSPGQTLVLSGRADKPGSLGHHFLTNQPAGKPREQKLLLMRLMRAPTGGVNAVNEIPPAAAIGAHISD